MSTKNNKAYKDVLLELDKSRKLTQYVAYRNALIKVKHTTEDTKLKSLIDAYVRNFDKIEGYAKKKMAGNASNLVYSCSYDREELRSYCMGVVSSGEPEWAVVARLNGWGPLG